MKKCQLCKKELKDKRKLKWGQGEIHIGCYTPDKQKDYDIWESKLEYDGERSPYWDWVQRHSQKNEDGLYEELPQANPDVLSSDPEYWNVDEEENEENRKVFIEKFSTLFNRLTRQQRKVMFAIDQYKTEAKAAKALGISQPVVSKTLKIVRKKLLQQGIFSQKPDTI